MNGLLWPLGSTSSYYNIVLGEDHIMGVSYYRFYSGQTTLASLKTRLTNMTLTWKKSVVAETDTTSIPCC